MFQSIRQALEPGGYWRLMDLPPQRNAFLTALKLAIKEMGGAYKVEEAQILDAVEGTDDVRPAEAAIITHLIYGKQAH